MYQNDKMVGKIKFQIMIRCSLNVANSGTKLIKFTIKIMSASIGKRLNQCRLTARLEVINARL